MADQVLVQSNIQPKQEAGTRPAGTSPEARHEKLSPRLGEIVDPRSDSPKEARLRDEVYEAEKWGQKIAIEQGLTLPEKPKIQSGSTPSPEQESLTMPASSPSSSGQSFEEFAQEARARLAEGASAPTSRNSEHKEVADHKPTWYDEYSKILKTFSEWLYPAEKATESPNGLWDSSWYLLSRTTDLVGDGIDGLTKFFQFASSLDMSSTADWSKKFGEYYGEGHDPRFIPGEEVKAIDPSYEMVPGSHNPNSTDLPKAEIQKTYEDLRRRWDDQKRRNNEGK